MSTPTSTPSHLILLTCHSIYTGPQSGPPESASSWLLAPFQKDGNEHLTFIQHIELASSLLQSDAQSLLVISGGYTRSEMRKSEARGYYDVGVQRGVWGAQDRRDGMGTGRIVLEEMALDSFGNLLRGMLAFWRETQEWPGKVTIVSHEFKRPRFWELHCRALRVGAHFGDQEGGGADEGGRGMGSIAVGGKGVEVFFRGKNPGFMDTESAEFDAVKCEDTRRGESECGYGEWEGDLWGVGERLRRKRERRDAWGARMGDGDGSGGTGAGEGAVEAKKEGRALFESEEERKRSGIRTRWLDAEEGLAREEVIVEGVEMPWEW